MCHTMHIVRYAENTLRVWDEVSYWRRRWKKATSDAREEIEYRVLDEILQRRDPPAPTFSATLQPALDTLEYREGAQERLEDEDGDPIDVVERTGAEGDETVEGDAARAEASVEIVGVGFCGVHVCVRHLLW